MHRSRPIAATIAAAIGAYLALIAFDATTLASLNPEPSFLVWLFAGALYAQLFEFWAHRVPMHRGMPLLENVRRNHLIHHRTFYGDGFRTKDPVDLSNIAGRWWVFPLLLWGHFAVLRTLVPAPIVASFLLGSVLHYTTFEAMHWLTHVEDNAFDRFVAALPCLGGLRARQIEHHRRHHEVPEIAFNFNPPYLGDRLFGLMPGPEAPPEIVVPEPQPVPVPEARPWVRPALRYGSALLIGAAVVGVAVIAHGRWTEGRVTSAARETVL